MLHYTTRVLVNDAERTVIHSQDILDACDHLVTVSEELATDTSLPAKLRGMVDSHAAQLIRTAYDQIIAPGEEHYILVTQVGMPMIRLVVRREADLDLPTHVVEEDSATSTSVAPEFTVITMGSPC